MYRESEAQTDPYAPDYVVRPGSQPELLLLEPLTHGAGLPVNQRTMELIEKIKNKREWLKALPPMDSEENIRKRHVMMEEREMMEWGEREDELNKLQDRRLKALEKAMLKRENDHAFLEDQRIEYIRQKKLAGKEAVLKKIQAERVKAIRRLAEKRKYVEGKFIPEDIIKDYSNGGSEVYAPLVRNGVFTDKVSESVDRKHIPGEFLTLEGISELESTIPQNRLEPMVRRPEKRRPVTVHERKAALIAKHIEEVDRNLKLEKAKATDRAVPTRYLKRVELPPPRPPTPSVAKPIINEDAEVAAILLQRLLRGRAVQNEMFEGKQKRLELIRELQIVQTYNQEPLRTELEKQAFEEHKTTMVDSMLDNLQGEITGQTLDFLANELVRHQQDKIISELVREAERTRRIKEAKEAGLRQKEEKIRSEEDARFAIITKLNQQTADSFLDQVFDSAVQTASSLQAIHETRVKSENIIAVLDSLEDKLSRPEVVVADLVDNYLLANVENETIRREERLDELKFPLAAKQEVEATIDKVMAGLKL